MPNDGQTHIADGTTCRSPQEPCGPDPYSTLPAASGPHWSTPAAWGAYSTPQNESQVIHNLEHGGIVIWYDPALVDDAQVAELTSYVQSQVASGISGRFKFLLTPWGGSEDLGAAVAVTVVAAPAQARHLRHGRHPLVRRRELPARRTGAEWRAGSVGGRLTLPGACAIISAGA